MAQETAQMKLAREQAEKTNAVEHDWPRDAFNTPMVKISCAAAELIPHRQFGNITVGPVQVTRFVIDGPDEVISGEIERSQRLCDAAVARDSETLHEQIREHKRVYPLT